MSSLADAIYPYLKFVSSKSLEKNLNEVSKTWIEFSAKYLFEKSLADMKVILNDNNKLEWISAADITTL